MKACSVMGGCCTKHQEHSLVSCLVDTSVSTDTECNGGAACGRHGAGGHVMMNMALGLGSDHAFLSTKHWLDTAAIPMPYLARQHGLFNEAAAAQQHHVAGCLASLQDHHIARHQLPGRQRSHPALAPSRGTPAALCCAN